MKINWIRIGGGVLAVASGVAMWLAVDSRLEHEQFVRCSAENQGHLIDVLNARIAPADRDRAALKQVFLDVANSTSREQTLAALNRYNAAIAASDLEREKVKLPDIPARACNVDD